MIPDFVLLPLIALFSALALLPGRCPANTQCCYNVPTTLQRHCNDVDATLCLLGCLFVVIWTLSHWSKDQMTVELNMPNTDIKLLANKIAGLPSGVCSTATDPGVLSSNPSLATWLSWRLILKPFLWSVWRGNRLTTEELDITVLSGP